MKFERYSEYKDSGIDWLRDIPSDWEVRRFANIGNFSKGRGISKKDLKEAGESVVLYGDIYTKFNIKTGNFVRYTSLDTAKKSTKIKKNDLLFTGSGETIEDIGKCITYLGSKIAYAGGDVILFRQKKESSLFLSYFQNAALVQSEKSRLSKGQIIVHIYSSKLRNIHIALPILKTQTKIANYLDTQTAKIDKKIILLEQKIQKYQELKQALINETVLRGLDKATPLKDSGIEWIGNIPQHWQVKRLKECLTLISSGITIFEGTKKYLSTKSINENIIGSIDDIITINEKPSRANMQPEINTVWFAKMRFTNKNFVFNDKSTCDKYILSTGFCGLKSNLEYLKFVNYYIVSKYFILEKNMNSYGTTQESISDRNISILNYIQPTLKEQTQIANYLDEKTSQIDSIINAIQTQITTLTEFRKTLINDTVTGKIKVA